MESNEEAFYEIILGGLTKHEIFMFDYLSQNAQQNDKHSVKVFDHEVEIDWDYPDPPECSWGSF